MSLILSPDRQKYYDGHSWLPALLSEDGQSVWDGQAWLPLAPSPIRPRSEASAIAWSYALCAFFATPLILLGTFLDNTGLKAAIDALAALPLLGIHTLKDSLFEGRLQPPSRASLRPLVHLSTSSWWISGATYGGLLSLFDNTFVVLFAFLFGPLAILLPFFAALGLGAFISYRSPSSHRSLRVVFPMAFIAAFFNSLVALNLTSAGIAYASSVGGLLPGLLLGTFFGGLLLSLLAAIGYFVLRLPRLLRLSSSSYSLNRPVVLSADSSHFWNGSSWSKVQALSDDAHYAWNGSAWLPCAPAPSTPSPTPSSPSPQAIS